MEYKNHIEHYRIDGEYYDYFAFDKFMKVEIIRRYQEILSLGISESDTSILDIGSGGGQVLSLIKNKCAKYLPFDISFNNLKRIKDLSTPNVFPVEGDGYNLPFKNDKIDLIMISEVIEHLTHPIKVLKEAARVLKPEGKLVVSVPYKEQISYQICIHCNNPTPTHSHLHSFSIESMRGLLMQAGLNPIKKSKSINKVLNRLHLNYYFRWIPYRIWKILDSFFNLIIDKPTSLIFVCSK